MPRMPKHDAVLVERLRELVGPDPEATIRPMFGSVGAFANGHMFAAVFGDDIGVKLSADGLAELRALGGGDFGPMPMKDYATLPPAVLDADAAAWLARARAHVMGLPTKVKSPKKR